MADKLKEIDYKKVFHFFEEISNVPRGPEIIKESVIILWGLQKNVDYIMNKMR